MVLIKIFPLSNFSFLFLSLIPQLTDIHLVAIAGRDKPVEALAARSSDCKTRDDGVSQKNQAHYILLKMKTKTETYLSRLCGSKGEHGEELRSKQEIRVSADAIGDQKPTTTAAANSRTDARREEEK